VYPDALGAHGLAWVRHREAEQTEMQRIIIEELVSGIF
jgi:aspartate/glutamate racemase